MSFLTPWFLLGALAIAGPVLFHLIRRAARERMPFSSLMFLCPTPPRVTRRRKLEHLWLLLLRCLALLLLAIGFARPFFAKDTPLPVAKAEARRLVLLVDTSASMRREGLWDQARARVESYLDQASPADQIAVLSFDRQPRTLVSFADWSAWGLDQRATLARQRLAVVSPGWFGTQLGLGLTSAAEEIMDDSDKDKPATRREVVLITDLQEGARLDGLQGHDWPSGVKVTVERLDARRRSNAGVQMLNESAASAGEPPGAHVRVANARDSGREKFSLSWTAENSSAIGEPMEIYLPPGQSRSFAAPKLSGSAGILPAAGGTPAVPGAAQLRLTGDEESFDNVSFYVAPEAERILISWFGPESANDPEKLRYYLQRVFPETPRRQVQLVRPFTNSAFSPALLDAAAFAVIADKLTVEQAAAAHDWLARGRMALLVLGDVQMGPTLTALAGWPNEVEMAEVRGEYALLGEMDFTHPIFAAFADPRFSDFTHIHFWKHRRWEIPPGVRAQVLARFDDGSPALVQLPVGQGNLLVLASGWNPADSQLAVSSKFPPLMQRMLEWSGAATPMRFQFQTGDAIPSPPGARTASSASIEWQRPDGRKQTLPAGAPFTETDLPGVYVATAGGKPWRYAVNLTLDESRTAPLAPDELARLGVPLQTTVALSATQTQARERHLQRAELENRQKLWRWLIAGVLAVVLGEILLAGGLARRVKTVEVAA